MTQVKAESPSGPRFARRWQIFALPVIIVAALAIAAVVVARRTGWNMEIVAIAASGVTAALSVGALTLLLRARSDRGSTVSALENVEARLGGIIDWRWTWPIP